MNSSRKAKYFSGIELLLSWPIPAPARCGSSREACGFSAISQGTRGRGRRFFLFRPMDVTAREHAHHEHHVGNVALLFPVLAWGDAMNRTATHQDGDEKRDEFHRSSTFGCSGAACAVGGGASTT